MLSSILSRRHWAAARHVEEALRLLNERTSRMRRDIVELRECLILEGRENRGGATRKSLPAKKTPLEVADRLREARTPRLRSTLVGGCDQPASGDAALHANPSRANPARPWLGQADQPVSGEDGKAIEVIVRTIVDGKEKASPFRTTAGCRARINRSCGSILQAGGKRAMAVWHRRAGKDEVCLHHIDARDRRYEANYWYCLPEFDAGTQSDMVRSQSAHRQEAHR